MKTNTFFWILILGITSFMSCDVSLNDVNAIEENCDTSDLSALAKANDIPDACKEAINNALPKPEDNLTDNIFKTGVKISDETIDLLFSFSDPQLNPLDSGIDLLISSFKNGQEEPIAISEDNFSKASNYEISVSAVIDYSGSMSDTDIIDANSIYNDFFSIAELTERVKANHIIFSDVVEQIFDFKKSLNNDFIFQKDFQRVSTSLLDGIGKGLESLLNTTSPVRIILVVTDGLENSSTIFTRAGIVDIAKINNLNIIFLGSLFSDIKFLKELSQETGGFFIYNRTIIDLREQLLLAGETIANSTYQFTIPYSSQDSLVVNYKTHQIKYVF